VALAAIDRAQGQEQAAFAPFLPQIDFLTHYGVTSRALGPASAGITGITLANGMGMHTYAEGEVQLQWTLYDFGRRRGRYGRAVAREQIAGLQSRRAQETVAFDVANAYLQALEARASRIIQEETIRRAESTLKDIRSRRAAGVADKDDVLRGDVQLAEAQDGLDLAEEQELAALARLNNAMGRNASLPLQLIPTESAPAFQQSLVQCLEVAAGQRQEIGVARQVIAGAQSGRQAAHAEFLPRVYALGSAGVIGGEHILTGVQEGAGLHISVPLYYGGRHQGDLRSADAEVREAVASSQVILDAVSLEVTLAYRSVTTAQKRIDHLRPAIAQARENLRLVGNKYRNGTATPTDIVDAETALTRAQQRFSSATSEYLGARARLDYAQGSPQGSWLDAVPASHPEPLPPLPGVKQP
jgi:outer membrane protein TolC